MLICLMNANTYASSVSLFPKYTGYKTPNKK